MPHDAMNITLKKKIVPINQHIILNAFNLNDPGLFRGKMGIILYFYIFSRYHNEQIYEDFASELLLDLFGEINTQIPFFLDDGLCGIGWGIEFLVQHNYIPGETNEILSDADQYIMQIDPMRLVDDKMDKGLLGLVHYVTTRLTSMARNHTIPFDPGYLKSLYNIIVEKEQISPRNLHPIFKEYTDYYQQPYSKKIEFDLSLLDGSPEITTINELNIRTYPLGISNGLSGVCLKKIISS